MTLPTGEQQAFLAAIRKDPCDNTLRLIYADWLEEHGRPDEADRQRDWKATSRKWMVEFTKKHHAYGKYHHWDREKEDPADVETNSETAEEYFNDFMEFLHGHVCGEGQFGFYIPYDFKEYSDEMWEHFEALTGERPLSEYRRCMPDNFSCVC